MNRTTGLHKCKDQLELKPSLALGFCRLVAVVVVRFMVAMATF